MSSDVPIQIVVAAFQDEQGADGALKELRTIQSQGVIKIDDAAVMRRDKNNKLHIKESADMGGGKGATIGGVTGAVFGLLAGPVGWGLGIGALVGGLAAKLHDTGFPQERLEQVGQGLRPGTSALVVVLEHTWVRKVEQELEQQGADVLTESLRRDIASQLEAGRDVAYSALSTAGMFAVEREAIGEGEGEVDLLVATDQGVYAASATMGRAQGTDQVPATAGGSASGGEAPGTVAPADVQQRAAATPEQPTR
jgi:uncharacterized membrane protein